MTNEVTQHKRTIKYFDFHKPKNANFSNVDFIKTRHPV